MCLFAAKRDQGRSEDGVRKKMHDTLPNDTVCCSQNVLRTDQRAATNEFALVEQCNLERLLSERDRLPGNDSSTGSGCEVAIELVDQTPFWATFQSKDILTDTLLEEHKNQQNYFEISHDFWSWATKHRQTKSNQE